MESGSGQHVLIGDTSWGQVSLPSLSHQDIPSQGCAAAGFYGVYGAVSALRGWVDSTIAGNFGADFCPGGPEPDTV